MQSKVNTLLSFGAVLIIAVGTGFIYGELQGTQTKIVDLQNKLAALELKMSRQGRISVIQVKASEPKQEIHQKVFQFLQTLNGVRSPEDLKKPKRIAVLDKTLRVQDLEVVREDAFFDLLGVLMDDEWIQEIRLPSHNAFFRSVRQEMLRFGVPAETLKTTESETIDLILKAPL